MAYGDFKDLPRRTASDKVLHDKPFNVAKNRKYDGYQRGLASTVYKFFNRKSSGSGVNGFLNGEEIAGMFYEKELQKTNQTEFRIVKVIKKKGDKLC